MKYNTFFLLVILSACSHFTEQEAIKVIVPSKVKPQVKMITPVKKMVVFKRPKNTSVVRKYCKKINKNFLSWGWGNSKCLDFKWHHVRNSVKGDPLMWATFGDEKAHRIKAKDTTLILCGVHGDEITPIKLCYDILYSLKKNVSKDPQVYADKMIVVVPIVNPDSYFKKRPTRTNANGVDINRNFPTRDWKKSALSKWKGRYRSDPRRFPGKRALSEPEVLFQVNLIKRYSPDKIVSVHAPLTIIDYDGPKSGKGSKQTLGKINYAKELLVQMSSKAGGYKILNYPFFPGSLGNYAGFERNIPTYTLELPSSDNRKSKEYWKLFKNAIHSAIYYDFKVGQKERPASTESAKN